MVVVKTYRSLIRAVGFSQHHLPGKTLVRGQRKCYLNLRPSLFRAEQKTDPLLLDGFMEDYRQHARADLLPEQGLTTEPLLQHYGFRTRWLDLVDSLPHALFFATHHLVRSPTRMGQMTYVPSLDAQGYIYVLEFNDPIAVKSNNKVVPGLWECGQHLLCNLRTEKPSLALRPHSQHGFLCRDSGLGATDLWGLVRARITIPTDVARQWINGAEALSRESLFPDRLWDGVYGKILSSMVSNFVMQERMLGRDFGSVTRYDFVDSGADDDRAVIDPEAVRSGQLVGPAAG